MESLGKLLSTNPRVLDMRYREREAVCEPARVPFAVRLDGVGFGKRLADFPSPRSVEVHGALVDVAKALARQYGAEFVHVVSDEVNLVFFSQLPYGGRTFKIVSVLAAHASAALTHILGRPLHFDGRVVKLEDKCDAALYLLYRARVGFNNYVVQMARLGGFIKEKTPSVAELLRYVQVDNFELAWGVFMDKEMGYGKEGDLCRALSRLCQIC